MPIEKKSRLISHESGPILPQISAGCLLVLTLIAVTGSLMYLKNIVVPLVLSIFLYFMLVPTIEILQRKLKIPWAVAFVLVILVSTIGLLLFLLVVSHSIRTLVANFDTYQVQIQSLGGALSRLATRYEINGLAADEIPFDSLQVVGWIKEITQEILKVVGDFFLILIYLIFLLSGSRKILENASISTITSNISKYIWLKFLLSLLTAFVVGGTLAAFGLDLYLMFGMLAFGLNFIPNLGALLTALLPLPIALLQFGFGIQTLLVLVVPTVLQFLIGSFLETRWLGKSLDLHPVTILFFLLFWGIVWGLPGMFLAVPITFIVKFFLSEFDRTKPLAELLAGRVS